MIALFIKLKLKMFMKNFTKTKSYLTSVITQKIQNICNHSNNLVEAKMKDVIWTPIKGFAGLKYKMYTSILENSHESKVKCINKNVFDDQLKYDDYKNVLFNKSYMRNEMKTI